MCDAISTARMQATMMGLVMQEDHKRGALTGSPFEDVKFHYKMAVQGHDKGGWACRANPPNPGGCGGFKRRCTRQSLRKGSHPPCTRCHHIIDEQLECVYWSQQAELGEGAGWPISPLSASLCFLSPLCDSLWEASLTLQVSAQYKL